ncbi:MAG TPA: hypothetical protein VFI24_02795 [Pyrinomonadaceae bacterium]|nr:hypothetical protein [Pyrinomonadaceae bacterium]
MCPNPETGGPTTHAGINFQNCIAVLRLARMLADTEFGENSLGKIIAVRSEAPTEVDDVVVTYSSQRREYIQAKLRVSPGDSAWDVMWQHFYKQYQQPDFNREDLRDIITIAIQWTTQAADLDNLLSRAMTSESYTVWRQRITQPQSNLLETLLNTLSVDGEEMLKFCKHIRVWRVPYDFDPLKSDSFENEVRRVIQGVVFPAEGVFSILLGFVATTASLRTNLTYESVVAHLNQRGVEVKRFEARPFSLSVEEQGRLLQKLDGLITQYNLLSERINRLRAALAIETDVERQFSVQTRLQLLEEERSNLSKEITEIEQTGVKQINKSN